MKNIRLTLSWLAILLSISVLLLPFVTGDLVGNEFQWTGGELIGNMASPRNNSFTYFVYSTPKNNDQVSQIIDQQSLTSADLAKGLPFALVFIFCAFAVTAVLLVTRAKQLVVVIFAIVICGTSFACFVTINLLNEALIRDTGDKLRGAEGTVGYDMGAELLQHISLKPAIGSYLLVVCAILLLLAQGLALFRKSGPGHEGE